MPGECLFDRRATLDNLGDDVEILHLIADTFVDDAPRLISELRDAVAQQDAAAAVRAGHSLKGSAANFGAAPLARVVSALEQSCRTGDFAAALASMDAVEALVSELCRELAAA